MRLVFSTKTERGPNLSRRCRVYVALDMFHTKRVGYIVKEYGQKYWTWNDELRDFLRVNEDFSGISKTLKIAQEVAREITETIKE